MRAPMRRPGIIRPMTDRGLPIVDGAPACPFVAFEDDRDGRGLAPDHRHRCFAEPKPAPRALAHQEAYCLSSAFPVCPTFQDWARREAAATRGDGGQVAAEPESGQVEELPDRTPMPPLDLEPRHASSDDAPQPVEPRRNPPRDWAAPPPWSDQDAEVPPMTAPPPATGDDQWSGDDRQPADAGAWGGAAQGLSASSAYRWAGPDPSEPPPARSVAPLPPAGRLAASPPVDRDARLEDAPPDDHGGRTGAAPDRRDDRRGGREPRAAAGPQVSQRDPQDPADLFGPAWEPPRRYEAYPSLRTRVGLPSVGRPSSLGLAAIAVVLAAAVLFFLGPMLLGIGSNDGGTGSATEPPSAAASATPAPTPPPAPTPQIYVVARNDTISKIARRFGMTQEELLAANPQIKNPNRINVGDKITIPVPAVPDATGAVSGGSASPGS
jgi:hypothetical protein